MKIGFGYDLHKLKKGRKLILGGVHIASDSGTIAHSDGDVLVHAIIDSLLGAAGNRDIGHHFPDTNPDYKDISSMILLEKTADIITGEKLKIANIDTTVVLDAPKLSSYIETIINNIADKLKISSSIVSVKAKTSEGTRKNATEAYSVCLLENNR